ncbi:phosphotransferase family protein [Streptomyces sp. NPDC056716]|uniref:phosphotransferase family protein n=1 Tax=unclassified Streptomyces TaxID=2593676 RepID=UPI0036A8116B
MTAPGRQPPSLPALLGPALGEVLGGCRRHTGPLRTVRRLTGGNVAHVFRLRGTHASVIVKIRRERFARIPQLRTEPALIADEHRALGVYTNAVPGVFPTVLAFHRDAHALVLTDVFPGGRNYQERLSRRPATVAEMTRLGRTLRTVHHATRHIGTQIRSQGDTWFREHTFDFCLRAAGHPALDRACEQMPAQRGQQLVLGDLAPKNLALTALHTTLCDLDNVHRGWPLFDLAYFTAHLLIHHLNRPRRLPGLVQALNAGYLGTTTLTCTEQHLAATVTAGVVLYRLANRLVPYPLNQPPRSVGRYRARVLGLLDAGTFTTHDLVQAARTARTTV